LIAWPVVSGVSARSKLPKRLAGRLEPLAELQFQIRISLWSQIQSGGTASGRHSGALVSRTALS